MTSSILKKGLLLSVLASASVLSVGIATAQDSFDAHVADIIILQPKAVQTDLGITEKQRDRLTKYAEAHAAKIHAFFEAQTKKGVKPESITPADPTVVSYYEALKTNIISVLTPAQLRRLREITLQVRGFAMLLDPVVGVRLGITAPERERLKAVIEQFAKFAQEADIAAYKQVSAAYQGVKPKDQADRIRLENEFRAKLVAASQPKKVAAHKLMDSQVSAILTPAQRANWKSLLGKPIKQR